MQNLEKRIAALETVNVPPEELTIFRRIVEPGRMDAEMHHISDDDGKQWPRQTGETENAFIDRAERETRANENGLKCLLGKPLDMTYATN